MSDVLSKQDYKLVRTLKQMGILLNLEKPEVKRRIPAVKDSVIFGCSDGHVDYETHARAIISAYVNRPGNFGGTLDLCSEYAIYDEPMINGFLKRVALGMELKKAEYLILLFHFPCGMATHFKHSLKEIFSWIPDAFDYVKGHESFLNKDEMIYVFFHVKRINAGGELEENTYLLDVEKLQAFIADGWFDCIVT